MFLFIFLKSQAVSWNWSCCFFKQLYQHRYKIQCKVNKDIRRILVEVSTIIKTSLTSGLSQHLCNPFKTFPLSWNLIALKHSFFFSGANHKNSYQPQNASCANEQGKHTHIVQLVVDISLCASRSSQPLIFSFNYAVTRFWITALLL